MQKDTYVISMYTDYRIDSLNPTDTPNSVIANNIFFFGRE